MLMATLKLLLDKRYKSKRLKKYEINYPLILRVFNKRVFKNVQLGYRLRLNQWDDESKSIRRNYPNSGRANARISRKLTIAREILADESQNIKKMDVHQIIKKIESAINKEFSEKINPSPLIYIRTTLLAFGNKIIERMKKAGRFGNAESIRQGINSLLLFHGNNKLLIAEITETFLLDYEAYCQSKGIKTNSYGAYLRAVRTIYNLAIKDKTTEIKQENYPFGRGGYSIKSEKSKKRAVKPEIIQKLRQLTYKENSPLWHHRNYFLFMYNMRGMNFIDLSFLRIRNIIDGRLIYKRIKTKRAEQAKEFNIKLTDEAINIINYYTRNKSLNELIFPILGDNNATNSEKSYKIYEQQLRNHNRRLGTISKDMELDIKLTTYVARHTFATTGLHRGISKAQIGDMLGHTNYYTTEAYFGDFDKEVLDEAADVILGAIAPIKSHSRQLKLLRKNLKGIKELLSRVERR